MRLLPLFVFILFALDFHAQVLIDEIYSDWNEGNLRTEDPTGDVSAEKIDFSNLWVSNDEEYIFISFDLGKEINLQDFNKLALYIDMDNSIASGEIQNGIGADLIYNFGDREGIMYIDGFLYFIGHNDIGLITAPTVSSERFEIAIKRSGNISNDTYNFNDNVKLYLEDDISNGDKIPDNVGGISFNFDNSISQNTPEFSFTKQDDTNLRILCYNSLFDGLFEDSQRSAQRRLVTAANPDIIGFQEIYDHDANDVASVIESLLPLENGAEWYRAKISPDIIVISKFPIIGIFPISGNGAFRIDLGEKEMLLIVAHLPCCGSDFGRQEEADHIISFLREAKNGNAGFQLENGSPIVIMGDMNLVGLRRQRETLLTGDILDEATYGPDINPDWDGGSLTDARFYNTGQPASVTWFSSGSSFNPGRLDYIIYSSSAMTLKNSFSFYTPTMANADLDNLGLNRFDSDASSDHIPLIGDFDIGLTSSISLVSDEMEKLKLYPNPNSGNEIFIELKSNKSINSNFEINVLNSFGQLVYHKYLSSHEVQNGFKVNVSDFQVGSYFVELVSEKGIIKSSFIKL